MGVYQDKYNDLIKGNDNFQSFFEYEALHFKKKPLVLEYGFFADNLEDNAQNKKLKRKLIKFFCGVIMNNTLFKENLDLIDKLFFSAKQYKVFMEKKLHEMENRMSN